MESSFPLNRASPRYDIDSNGDTDESWQFVDYSSNGSAAPSVGFLPSPGSGSLNGYAVVGYVSTPSQPSSSPLSGVEMDQLGFLPPSTSNIATTTIGNDAISANTGGSFPGESFLTPQNYLFSSNDLVGQTTDQGFPNNMALDWQQMDSVGYSVDMNAFQLDHADMSFLNAESLENVNNVEESSVLQWQSDQLNVTPEAISPENFMSWPSDKSSMGSSPKSPSTKSDTSHKSSSLPFRKVQGSKVQKNRSGEQGKFFVMTPNSISAQSGRPNPFECFEAMRTTQRGRKGPLADSIKENALQVRRQGACFCCRSRKVKCDTQRPCQHCTKLMTHVPQVVCWQFHDFLTTLFPDFIRGHLRKENVYKFVSDNVEGFLVDGQTYPCEVKLFSGPRFTTTLSVDANFFTAKTCDVLQHWHLKSDNNGVDLQSNGSTPIGIDVSAGKKKKEQLRKKVKSYVQDIIGEEDYAEQVTDSLKSSQLPVKVLRIAQTYANKTDSPIVKKALSIYAMQYIMTRHLCLTAETIFNLQSSGLVPQNSPWVTPRVLARQVKAVVDELCMKEMQNLFELFTKALKPKYRREWAPSLAAFLVLSLFMEAVETMTDNFVIAQNRINLRDGGTPQFKRSFALDMCTEVENLPFKQFAYQFHNIYQTHSRDANSKAFNPLFDSSFQEAGELDEPAIELVESIKELYYGEDWQDIQYLVDDDVLLNRVESPSCLDTSFLYSGRLVAKFLMSFRDENAIFGSKI